jgi:hypothetical protein
MLVIDFMHECELGTWKALFTHLIRLLYSLPGGSQLVATFDRRYAEFVLFFNPQFILAVDSARFRPLAMA